MRLNSINSVSFKALSTRAALHAKDECKSTIDKRNLKTLIVAQAKNENFHVDCQNGKYVVCELNSDIPSALEKDVVKVSSYIPYKLGMYSCPDIYEACAYANQLEENSYPHNEILSDKFILNHTV